MNKEKLPDSCTQRFKDVLRDNQNERELGSFKSSATAIKAVSPELHLRLTVSQKEGVPPRRKEYY